MTCREKLKQEHPEQVGSGYMGGCERCPSDYGYARQRTECKPCEYECWKCWNREVEEVENGTKKNGTKDSGVESNGDMTVFESGAVRDKKTGKGRCDLLPACVLLRLAKHYERGAERYGPYNWQKGIPCHSFVDSALRHLLKYMDGQTDEDHLIAAVWNLCGLAWTEEKLPDLMDIPERQGK